MVESELFFPFHDIRSKLGKNLVETVRMMDVQINRFGDVQTKDAHDGFGIDYVTTGNQIELCVKAVDQIDKRFYFINGI